MLSLALQPTSDFRIWHRGFVQSLTIIVFAQCLEMPKFWLVGIRGSLTHKTSEGINTDSFYSFWSGPHTNSSLTEKKRRAGGPYPWSLHTYIAQHLFWNMTDQINNYSLEEVWRAGRRRGSWSMFSTQRTKSTVPDIITMYTGFTA